MPKSDDCAALRAAYRAIRVEVERSVWEGGTPEGPLFDAAVAAECDARDALASARCPNAEEFMEWPAPPSGVVGSPANQEEEGMDISVLGIDLGKNVCSVVGLDASGAVVMRRKVRRETLIALAEKLPPCVVGMEACCGAHHLGRVFAPTATMSG